MNLHRAEWMPSPPLAPADPVDHDVLDNATVHDPDLAAEVLGMFGRQAADVLRRLRTGDPEWVMLLHRLKGSALAIGAARIVDACTSLENRHGATGVDARDLRTLEIAVLETRRAIANRLNRP